MKIGIDRSEWWPVLEIVNDTEAILVVDVPDDVVKRWKEAFDLFDKVQDEMDEVIERKP